MPIPFQLDINPERIIRGDFFPSRQKLRGNMIFCHGFKGFKDWGFIPHAAQSLAEHFNVITFNFSHNGVGEDRDTFSELDKFAKNTYSKELEDLQTVVHHLQQGTLPLRTTGDETQSKAETSAGLNGTEHAVRAAGGSTLPLFLLGHSRGAGVSLIYAFDHPDDVAGIISWNGITHVDLFSDEQKKEMRQNGRTYIANARTKQNMPLDVDILEDMEANRDRFNIIARVQTCEVPILLVQGTDDHPHLLDGSRQLMANNPAVKRIDIPGGNHTFNAVHPFKEETKPLKAAIDHTRHWMTEISQRSAST